MERDRHAEDAALPGLLEDQLAVLARQGGLALHDRDHAVHREILGPRAVTPEGMDSQAWARRPRQRRASSTGWPSGRGCQADAVN